MYFICVLQEPNNPLTMRLVWDWGEQFSDRDVSLFFNPLYSPPTPTPHPLPPLVVRTSISCLHIWSQCYFRFIPSMEIIGGGKPQVNVSLCRMIHPVLVVNCFKLFRSYHCTTYFNPLVFAQQKSNIIHLGKQFGD